MGPVLSTISKRGERSRTFGGLIPDNAGEGAVMRTVVRLLVCAIVCGAALAPVAALAGGGGEYCAPLNGKKPPVLTVWVRDNCFTAKTLNVTTGQVVTWAPRDALAPHTVTAPEFNSGDLDGLFSVRFNAPGTYRYVCTYHGGDWGGMVGRVVVAGKAIAGTPEAEVLTPRGASESPEELLAAAEDRLATAITRATDARTPALASGAAVPVRLTAWPAAFAGLISLVLLATVILLVRRRVPD
jgi:plastocyanin